MSNWFYIGVAFGLTWAVLVAYFLYLGRRTRRAEEGLTRLSSNVEWEAVR